MRKGFVRFGRREGTGGGRKKGRPEERKGEKHLQWRRSLFPRRLGKGSRKSYFSTREGKMVNRAGKKKPPYMAERQKTAEKEKG